MIEHKIDMQLNANANKYYNKFYAFWSNQNNVNELMKEIKNTNQNAIKWIFFEINLKIRMISSNSLSIEINPNIWNLESDHFRSLNRSPTYEA